MAESLLDKISQDSDNSYTTDVWMNGEVGKVVDINGDGNYRFVDYVFESGNIRKRYISKEEELNCSVIATGIVGYWIHNRNKLTIKSLFESYYSQKMSQYEKEHENDDDAWNRDLEEEFALSYHIPTEKKAILLSKSILIFLTEEDVKKIENITKQYLKFIRVKRKTLCPTKFPSNRVIEDTFFSAYEIGGGAYECMDWFRIEHDLPYMGHHWGNGKSAKSQLSGRWKLRHEIDIPVYIKEEYDDFEDKVLMYSNGGMMDEINENIKTCQTKEDKIRYIISLLKPFKEFADAFFPNTRINERKKAIEEHKKWISDYEKMPEDIKDEQTGEPIHPQEQIKAINDSIEKYKRDIEYWTFVQDKFYWFAQDGLNNDFTEEENQAMYIYLGHWWECMIILARRLAALTLTYGINLMDIQEECGIFLKSDFFITDYVDEKFVMSHEHARKLLDEIESKNKNIVDKKVNTDNSNYTPVYISYNWSSYEVIVNTLCSALEKAGIKYVIDKKNCTYRNDIREFENQLGSADMIITIITEEYLKSIQCMRELALISKKGMMNERLFPIVNLKNREAKYYAEYKDYWIDRLKRNDIPISPGNDGPILEEKNDINLIINKLSTIWNYIKDVNSPSWETLSQNDCQSLIDEIKNRLPVNGINNISSEK